MDIITNHITGMEKIYLKVTHLRTVFDFQHHTHVARQKCRVCGDVSSKGWDCSPCVRLKLLYLAQDMLDNKIRKGYQFSIDSVHVSCTILKLKYSGSLATTLISAKGRCLTTPCALQWRHNGRNGVSNHQPHHWLLNRYSGADERKHQSSVSLAFVWGIHRWPVNSPHK